MRWAKPYSNLFSRHCPFNINETVPVFCKGKYTVVEGKNTIEGDLRKEGIVEIGQKIIS